MSESSDTTNQPRAAEQKRTLARANRKRNNLEGWLFIAPAFLFIAVFGLWPLLYTGFMSLHKWRIIKGPFIGFENYAKVFGAFSSFAVMAAAVPVFFLSSLKWFEKHPLIRIAFRLAAAALLLGGLALTAKTGDKVFVDSFRITVWYSLGAVPIQLAAGLLIAFALERIKKGKQFFRVVYLLPYIVPVISGAAIFERLFSLRHESFANQIITLFGLSPQQWLGEAKGIFTLIFKLPALAVENPFLAHLYDWVQGPSLALVSALFFNYWVFIGYYALIFANGLSQIPKDILEAGEVDGASAFQRLRNIVIPLLSPTTYFLTLLGIIGTFKSFTHLYVLGNSSSQGSIDAMSVSIFNVFYRRQQFGIAAAQAVFLLAVVIALTIWQQRGQGRRVHYSE